MKPLIACSTKVPLFSDRIEAAAHEIGTDFWASEDFGLTLEECRNRRLSCIVADYDNITRQENRLANRQRDHQSLIVVIPEGDVRAAFQASNVGAVNVIEESQLANELVLNLRTALASETRLQEFIESKNRFKHPMFDCLTQREKAIIALLMEGEPNKRVAAILDVGLRTVEGERAQVMKKLNLPSFVELIKTVSRVENDYLETRRNIFGSILPR